MSSIYDKLLGLNLLNTPPSFIKNNVHYEVITGSVAYGCNESGKSDMDVCGFCIPPKDLIFPQLRGLVPGFDSIDVFSQYQQHHIKHPKGTEYDISMYNIIQFFKLCMDNNPNMVDVLWVPRSCVLFSTEVGEHVRDNAELFLTKHAYHKFTSYAKSQLHKLQSKKINEFITFCKVHDIPFDVTVDDVHLYLGSDLTGANELIKLIREVDKDGKRTQRVETIAKYGFDLKFSYHLVRLLNECEQILTNHTLEINRDREIYKSIRRGDWTKQQIVDYFDEGEKRLRKMYDESTLRHSPDIRAVRQLLLNCLEMHYGSLEKCVANLDKHEMAIREIRQILDNYKL